MKNSNVSLPNRFMVLSANCQALRNYEKRMDVLSYLKDTNANIVCLQDTHLLDGDKSSIKQIWPDCYVNGSKTNSRGVVTLLNNNFEYTILNTFKDDEGNILQTIIDCGNFKLNLINVYAPNRDSPSFFSKVMHLAHDDNADYVMICGDFNLVLTPSIDCHNYVNTNNPQARAKVIEMMSSLDLIDAFRHLKPHVKRFSWRKKNPIKQARLDYFLIAKAMADMIDSCNIKPSYRSDHSIIEIKITMDNFIRGRGTWKFDNSLLKNSDYLDLIGNIINEEK